MRTGSVLALIVVAGLLPLDEARAGACDDLNAKVCAQAKDAAVCARLVTRQLRGADGQGLSGRSRSEACKALLADRSRVAHLVTRAKRHGDPIAALIGTWGIDMEGTMAADPKMAALPETARREAIAAAEQFLGQMTFAFTADGLAIARMGEKEERARYAITRRDGNRLTIELAEGLGSTAKTETLNVAVDVDRMEMKQGTQTLVLRRK